MKRYFFIYILFLAIGALAPGQTVLKPVNNANVNDAIDDDFNATQNALGFSAFFKTLTDDNNAATARTTLDAFGLTGADTVSGAKTFAPGSSIILDQDGASGNGAQLVWNDNFGGPTRFYQTGGEISCYLDNNNSGNFDGGDQHFLSFSLGGQALFLGGTSPSSPGISVGSTGVYGSFIDVGTISNSSDKIPSSSAVLGHAVSLTGTQTISGDKTFTGNAYFNGSLTSNDTTYLYGPYVEVAPNDFVFDLGNGFAGAGGSPGPIFYNKDGFGGGVILTGEDDPNFYTVNIPALGDADVVLTAGDQTIAGNKTFADGIYGSELSADPANPAEGEHVMWQSNGTGSGDDGDIMFKITAGGTTKTITLVDFSAAP